MIRLLAHFDIAPRDLAAAAALLTFAGGTFALVTSLRAWG